MQNSRVTPPQLAIPGEPIRASFINQIVRAVRAALGRTIRGTGGVIVDHRGDNVVVSLAPGYQDVAIYRIEAVRVDGEVETTTLGQAVVSKQNEITYDLAPYRRVEREPIENAAPNLGRVHQNGDYEILSAAVGDPAWVFSLVVGSASDRAVYVHVLNERIADPSVCTSEE